MGDHICIPSEILGGITVEARICSPREGFGSLFITNIKKRDKGVLSEYNET